MIKEANDFIVFQNVLTEASYFPMSAIYQMVLAVELSQPRHEQTQSSVSNNPRLLYDLLVEGLFYYRDHFVSEGMRFSTRRTCLSQISTIQST